MEKLIDNEIRNVVARGTTRPSDVAFLVARRTGADIHAVTARMQDMLTVRTVIVTDEDYIAEVSL